MDTTVTWTNNNPNTVYNKLARKLGREPTREEVKKDLDRIMGKPPMNAAELITHVARQTLPQ